MSRDENEKNKESKESRERQTPGSVADADAEARERAAEDSLMDEELTEEKEINDEDAEQRQDELERRLQELESSEVTSQEDYEALVGMYEDLIDIIEARLRGPAERGNERLQRELESHKSGLDNLDYQNQEYSLTEQRIQRVAERFLQKYERLIKENPQYHDQQNDWRRTPEDDFTSEAKDFFETVASKITPVDLGSGGNYAHDAMIRLPSGIIIERTVKANYDVDDEHYRFLDAKKFRDETLKKIADKQKEIALIESQLSEVSGNEAKKSKLEGDRGYLKAQIKWAQDDLRRFSLEGAGAKEEALNETRTKKIEDTGQGALAAMRKLMDEEGSATVASASEDEKEKTGTLKTFEDELTPRERHKQLLEDEESAGLRKLYDGILEDVREPLFKYDRSSPRRDTMLRADLAIAMHAAGDEHAADLIREAEKLIDRYNFRNDWQDYEEYDNHDIAWREHAIAIAALVRARGIVGEPDRFEEYRPYGRTEDGSDGGSYYYGPSLEDAYESAERIENPADKAEVLCAIAQAEAMNWNQGARYGQSPLETLQKARDLLNDIEDVQQRARVLIAIARAERELQMSNEWKSDDLNAIKTLDEAASVIRTMKDPEARIRATLDYAREGTANTDYLESEEHAEPHSQKFRKLRDALEMIDGLAMQYLREHPENQETELMHLFQAERSALSSHGDEIYYLVNLRAAERRIDKSREGNMNDPEIGARYVRAVNALVEVHAVRGNFEKAREVIEEYLHPDFQKEALVTIAKEVAKRIKKKETSPDE